MERALLVLTALITKSVGSWCQSHDGSCVGQRHSFEKKEISQLTGDPYHGTVRFADWDGDGDTDVLVGEAGAIWLHERLSQNTFQKRQLLKLEAQHPGELFNHLFQYPPPPVAARQNRFEVVDWDGNSVVYRRHIFLLSFHARVHGGSMILELLRSWTDSLVPGCSRVFGETAFGMFAVSHGRGDHQLDLLLCSTVNDSVTVRLWNRSTHVEEPLDFPVVLSTNGSVCDMLAVDFDHDGDLDLMLGHHNYQPMYSRYFERISESLVERTGRENPLEVFDHKVVTRGYSKSTEYYGHLYLAYFDSAADGSFLTVENPLEEISLTTNSEFWSEFYVADWNSDGWLDILVVHVYANGKSHWTLAEYFEHVLDRSLAQNSQLNAYQDVEVGPFSEHIVLDWNGDGAEDVVVLEDSERFHLYEFHEGSVRTVPRVFENITSLGENPYPYQPYPAARAAFADWDQDGDVDLIFSSQADGKLHYHEMISGSWTSEDAEHPFSNISLVNHPQPVVVDWDNDGDMDLFLGPPDGRFFEQLADGTLHEWPLEQSPVKDLVKQGDLAWRVLDCDADGDFDLLRLRSNHEQQVQACEHEQRSPHQLGTLRCDDDFLCLGTNLSHFKNSPGGPLEGLGDLLHLDLGDLKDGRLKFISVHDNAKGAVLWSAGFCVPSDPCHQRGFCLPRATQCSCVAGHELGDCSGCEPHFYSEQAQVGQMHRCKACPGADGQVCYGRGLCFDDAAAKAAAAAAALQWQSSTATLIAQGTGSCICNDSHFHGLDQEGRSTCAEGSCPAGTEESQGLCSPCAAGSFSQAGRLCKECGPGRFSLTGSSTCSTCPPGTVSKTSGASACDVCPAGTYEVDHQLCNKCPGGFISAAGNNSCSACEAGSFAPKVGSVACEPCPAGTYSGEASGKCSTCPSGTVSFGAGGACRRCEPGRFAQSSLTCEPCRGGTFASEGSSACQACPVGHVSHDNSATCSSCEGLFIRATPDAMRQSCQILAMDMVFALILWMTLASLCFLLFTGFSGRIPISDLSAQGEKLLVTTSIAHFLLSRPCNVTFARTGVPDLESSSWTWRVKATSYYHLALEGEKSSMPLDTSKGHLHVKFPQLFVSAGFARCPLIGWCVFFLAATVGTALQLTWRFSVVLGALGLCTGSFCFALRRRQGTRTPLAKRRHEFLQEWQPLALQRCSRGPDRSMSAGKLQRFVQFFDSFIKERSMYYVCSNIVKPLTKPFQLSFVELVGATKIQWFVSHYWGMPLRHFSDAIRKHAQSVASSSGWQDAAYWICTFSNSQWHVKDELGHGKWEDSSFYLALRSPECKGTTMIIDDTVQPLQRIWCLFEVYQTICLSRSDHFQGLLLCTSAGVLQQGNAGTDVAVAVAKTVAELDTCSAQATDEEDRQMIHSLIEQMPGGFHAMNSFVRETICKALKASHLHYEATLSDLMQTLTSEPSSSAPPAPVGGMPAGPTLLTSSVYRTPCETKVDAT
ncbi:unnamed protein product [Durusdinium trenchii]|uniref:EGF-like domain-containing protein n=1 Tax=Durusdinium trenchii TaxID=1381693 RepID=A0ABP0T0R2_9DINO